LVKEEENKERKNMNIKIELIKCNLNDDELIKNKIQ
jgi:hypothetical protein